MLYRSIAQLTNKFLYHKKRKARNYITPFFSIRSKAPYSTFRLRIIPPTSKANDTNFLYNEQLFSAVGIDACVAAAVNTLLLFILICSQTLMLHIILYSSKPKAYGQCCVYACHKLSVKPAYFLS